MRSICTVEPDHIRKAFSESNRRKVDQLARIGLWIDEGEVKRKLFKEQSSIIFEENAYNWHYRRREYANEPPRYDHTKAFKEILLFCEVYKDKWIRPLNEWKSRSKNSEKDMKSLFKHLFIKYNPPQCLINDLFSYHISGKHRSLIMDWIVAIGSGNNFRKLEKLPFTITKKASHNFHNSPDNCSTEASIRWAQIMAIGGDRKMAENIATSVFGKIFESDAMLGDENDHFWGTVFSFLINNPSITKDWYGRVYDYLRIMRLNHPNVSMNGRTPDSLIKQVLDFEKNSFKNDKQMAKEWEGMDLPKFEAFTEDQNSSGEEAKEHKYTIREITTSNDLKKESSAMSHCVWTYADLCAKNKISIFSMEKDGEKKITIEVEKSSRRINQKAGKFNRPPTYNDNMVIKKWAAENKIHY